MVTQTAKTAAGAQPKKKSSRSSGGIKKHRQSAYSKFMSNEMARLRDEGGVEDGAERRKLATAKWHTVKDSSP
ncbi:hypothetical protein B0H11DRAFT_2217870 [Mycena galericulata]|nr:hypothetical protein B0H11DRAFT_2217870 [Mycena galericulata]